MHPRYVPAMNAIVLRREMCLKSKLYAKGVCSFALDFVRAMNNFTMNSFDPEFRDWPAVSYYPAICCRDRNHQTKRSQPSLFSAAIEISTQNEFSESDKATRKLDLISGRVIRTEAQSAFSDGMNNILLKQSYVDKTITYYWQKFAFLAALAYLTLYLHASAIQYHNSHVLHNG